MFSGAEPFMQFGKGHYGEHSCEIIFNLDQWFRRRCLRKTFTDDRRMQDRSQKLTLSLAQVS